MIISIVTGGSRGDVQPYIALGKGLKEAGFEVRLIASDDFEQLVTSAGLAFYSTGYSVASILDSDEWRATTENGNFLKIVAKMRSEMKRQAQFVAQTMPDLVQRSDYILAGFGGIGGAFSIAEHLNIPIIQAYVFPITPTREFPSPLTPRLPLGNLLNPVSFRIMQQMLWQSVRSSEVETRRILGMSGAPLFGPFGKLGQPDNAVLYGYSRHVIPQPSDWHDNHYVTGYWFLEESSDWTPPDDFMRFLDAGDAPVYVGFGSMLNKNPEDVAKIVLEALKMSGQRGVIASGWGGLSQSDLPDTVYMMSSMPHTWLFPRMATVVHHGGAGTTAAGLRAGVPTVIVPFMGDQSYWGHKVHELGVGTQSIPRKKLTADRLAQAITQATSSPALSQKAKTLGEQIRQENGVQHATQIIEQLTQFSGIKSFQISL